MKRITICAAALVVAAALIGMLALDSEAKDAPIQFKGFVTYGGGGPAQIGTVVKASLNGVPKGQTTITLSTGYYELTGSNSNFPTGYYTLHAEDDNYYGQKIRYHVYDTETTCNIVMDISEEQ